LRPPSAAVNTTLAELIGGGAAVTSAALRPGRRAKREAGGMGGA